MNGLVAFLLPLVLTLEAVAFKSRHDRLRRRRSVSQSSGGSVSVSECAEVPNADADSWSDMVAYCWTWLMGGTAETEEQRYLLELSALRRNYSESDGPPADGSIAGDQQVDPFLGSTDAMHGFDHKRSLSSSSEDALYTFESNTVNSLPEFLLAHRRAIVILVEIAFTAIVVWSILMGLYDVMWSPASASTSGLAAPVVASGRRITALF